MIVLKNTPDIFIKVKGTIKDTEVLRDTCRKMTFILSKFYNVLIHVKHLKCAHTGLQCHQNDKNTMYWFYQTSNQCQLTVCFELQNRSDRRNGHKSCALEMVFRRKVRR